MWLELENGTLVNLELVSRVELNHIRRTAVLMNAGIVEHADSPIAYEHFMTHDSIGRANWQYRVETYQAKKAAEAEKAAEKEVT